MRAKGDADRSYIRGAHPRVCSLQSPKSAHRPSLKKCTFVLTGDNPKGGGGCRTLGRMTSVSRAPEEIKILMEGDGPLLQGVRRSNWVLDPGILSCVGDAGAEL